jgi:hypothetical protein
MIIGLYTGRIRKPFEAYLAGRKVIIGGRPHNMSTDFFFLLPLPYPLCFVIFTLLFY